MNAASAQNSSVYCLNDFLLDWRATRSLTHALLDSVDEGMLRRVWQRPGLDTYAKHFEEMAAVQHAFNDALITGAMDFSSVPSVEQFGGDLPRETMKQALNDADAELQSLLSNSSTLAAQIDWFGTLLPIGRHLVSYINHETFHHGQFTLAAYYFGYELPPTWKESWALP